MPYQRTRALPLRVPHAPIDDRPREAGAGLLLVLSLAALTVAIAILWLGSEASEPLLGFSLPVATPAQASRTH